jgi:hypothetical protein
VSMCENEDANEIEKDIHLIIFESTS